MRFRVTARPVLDFRRTADILFPRRRVAVFLDGCFWHGCPDHFTPPQTNVQYWTSKIQYNRLRDATTNQRLRDHGWLVVRVWEHEDTEAAADRIAVLVSARGIMTCRP
jgi:DNA mismatch endonuclease (patch repair protein)